LFRAEFFAEPITFDGATGKLTSRFVGRLYLPIIVLSQLISDGPVANSPALEQATVEGTWFIEPGEAPNFDPFNPPPNTIAQVRPIAALSHVRIAFRDGSVLELKRNARPLLSMSFMEGPGLNPDGSAYQFLFTETAVSIVETAGRGRFAGMEGSYTFHNADTIIGPNLQVHARGAAMMMLKKPLR
jgi:hypothetical protein